VISSWVRWGKSAGLRCEGGGLGDELRIQEPGARIGAARVATGPTAGAIGAAIKLEGGGRKLGAEIQ